MRFQVRDLMSNVLLQCGPQSNQTCMADSTGGQCKPCPPPSGACPGQSGCPKPSQKPPGIAREMLGILREQMRQALLPA